MTNIAFLFQGNVWQLNFNPVLVVLIGVVSGLVFIAFLIVLFVRWRTMKSPLHRYRGKHTRLLLNHLDYC